MNPNVKKGLAATGGVVGLASIVGASAHVGKYAALGFFDAKLGQAARAGKEFIPDGITALVGTLNRVAAAVFAHPVIGGFIIAGAALFLWAAKRSPRTSIALFILTFSVVVVLTLPAFEVLDLLRNPPDPETAPATRFARAFLVPVLAGMKYSRIRQLNDSAWDPAAIQLSLSIRYVLIVASTIYLVLIALLALPNHAVIRTAGRAIVLVAIIGASYYWGAIEEDTLYNRTVALDGHAGHKEHPAFLIANVGSTCSVYSFSYGNEDIDERFTDTDPDRKDDILLARLLKP